jgi:hypothetical protein
LSPLESFESIRASIGKLSTLAILHVRQRAADNHLPIDGSCVDVARVFD